ncbi:bifunctional glycosyltransferase/CDP-glycerol:glycerophosphate glycerophosphotransferase [Actinomadura formosensis]|uniref:bifunctional glycosyltransferase/CDP-glycerol:glycerophosphate glycerophosphotransferase n=1 Tax=Actinomadura formosensis TaxID=60706 RepID=UPI00082AFD7A|nr:bifunctional glycosyltransferase/CDP-glycerol:glycerophosphate glycerophosphotransferase [Actinomadura formosensis]
MSPHISPTHISIVVPFRDTGDRLTECLESLAGQTLRDIEVLMVDDGPDDGGGVVAKEFAGRDGRFTLLQPSPGTTAADAGVEQAKGRYLAFVAGEDVLPPYAYELMVGTLDSTGSDFAGGNVMCLDGEQVRQSPPHSEPYAMTRKSTHVIHHPALLRDRTLWNKVFRRSFWDAHRFELGEDKDVLVAVQAQLWASAVDVLDTPVYFRRDRPGTATRPRPEPADIIRRMATLAAVRECVHDHAPELLAVHDMYALDMDVHELMLALPAATLEECGRLVELGAEAVTAAGRSCTAGLEAIRRLELHLLGQRRVPELLEVLRFEEDGLLRDVPIVSRGRLRPRWYAGYPFFGETGRGIPEDVYDVTDEIDLQADVDRVEWEVDTLIIEGHAHFDRFDVSAVTDSRIRVWMRDAKTGKEVRLPVKRVRQPEVTARSGQANVSYDWSGFIVRVEPEYLLDGGGWRTATYELFAEVTTAGHRAVRRLTAMAPAVRWTEARQVDEHVAVQPAAGDDDVFAIHVKRAKAVLLRIHRDGDVLELAGWTRRALGTDAAVVASRRHGGQEVHGEVTLRQSAVMRMAEGTGFDFTARLPLTSLTSAPDGPAPYRTHLRDAIDWDIRLTGEGGPLRVTVASDVEPVRYVLPVTNPPAGAGPVREVALMRTAFGNLRAVERTARPVVRTAAWDVSGLLTLNGDFADPQDRPDHFLLRRRRSGDEHRIPVTWEEHRFTAAFTPAAMAVFGTDLPLSSGTWDVLAHMRSGEVAVVVEREAIPGLPGRRRVGTHEFEIGVHQVDALTLRSRPALGDDERGRRAQALLQQRDYPAYLRSPLSDLVVFDSYGGTQYSCSPKAIYKELVLRNPDLECVWVTQDNQFVVEGKARTVLAGSREHYRVLAGARHIITNHGLPPWYLKRDGQTYVQTWHGTPLKRLGYDLRDMPYQRTGRMDWVDWTEREVPRWDLLLSPSPYATRLMRRAFCYEGEILEAGYPRNDVLSPPEWENVESRVRKGLGIPDGKKVVLYAPTWRDDRRHGPGRQGFSLELDIETMRQALGDDHVLLLRAHHLVTDRAPTATDDFLLDVSRYPDIAELYMVADVLVTDYSSAMFDYAVLGRPIVLYTYDLERYRDHMRGLYFDLEAEAPGPVVTTSAEVAREVRAAPDSERRYADAYDRFFVKYCPHDDGRAAARVVDRLLGET